MSLFSCLQQHSILSSIDVRALSNAKVNLLNL
jgi:hypothetical protein